MTKKERQKAAIKQSAKEAVDRLVFAYPKLKAHPLLMTGILVEIQTMFDVALKRVAEIEMEQPPHRCSSCQDEKTERCPGCHQREWCDEGCKSCKGQKETAP